MKIPPLPELIDIYERAAQPVFPTKVIGICLNTYDQDEKTARQALKRATADTGLPTADPVRFDPGPLADAVARAAQEWRSSR